MPAERIRHLARYVSEQDSPNLPLKQTKQIKMEEKFLSQILNHFTTSEA